MKSVYGIAIALVLILSPAAFAEDPVGPKLTPRLKDLIAQEMQQIAEATASLSTAIASGDHHAAMELGVAVRNSFILKQSLTDQDKKDLMGAVPPAFVAMDRRFHGLAGKLAHAAEAGDSELQSIYYAKMLESCIACHTHFASDRFPGLAGDGGEHDH